MSVVRMDTHPKGYAFSCYLNLVAEAKGDPSAARAIAQRMARTCPEVTEIITRSVVPVGTTTSADFASALAVSTAMREIVDLLRPLTILGRLTGIRKVPFLLDVARATKGIVASWRQEGTPTSITPMSFDNLTKLATTTIDAATVITAELARNSHPSAQATVRGDIIASVVTALDQSFINPTVTAIADTRPAAITNGAVSVPSSGATAAAFAADLTKLLNALANAGSNFIAPFFVTHPRLAINLATMTNASSALMYPDVTARGGNLAGIPLITSASVPIDTGDDTILALLDASNILVADDGEAVVDIATEGTVQMVTNPDNPTTASTVFHSLWAENLIAIRASRRINWQPANAGAAAILTGIQV